MQVLLYRPSLGDIVTTVSLQWGRITAINGRVLTIVRSNSSEYYADADAVIRVSRHDQTFVVERRRSHSVLHPYETSWAQKEFMSYLSNRVTHGR